jgi:hypothetical protein
MHRDVSRSLKGHRVLAPGCGDYETVVLVHLEDVVVEAFVAARNWIARFTRFFPVQFVVLRGAVNQENE